MDKDFDRDWMWSEACEMLARAERLHRAFFRPILSAALPPAWEPPVDMLETEGAFLVFIALPGVNAEHAHVMIESGELVVAGARRLPAELETARIHRLELPQGRFERRLPLPPASYGRIRRSVVDGCLVITLEKTR